MEQIHHSADTSRYFQDIERKEDDAVKENTNILIIICVQCTYIMFERVRLKQAREEEEKREK